MVDARRTVEDTSHMRSALALARRGLGGTWPNPSVGCVIVREGRVIGRAVTAPGGRPHAERAALTMAGQAARGATVYVTLEPCCHHGRFERIEHCVHVRAEKWRCRARKRLTAKMQL